MSKITAMYIRLSMEDEDVSLNQKEESNSVSSQRELLEAFIGNHSELKDTKVQEYCDDGFTGTKFERPDYMKLMEDVRADKISCIVVKDDCVIIEPTQKDLENQGFVAGSICF